MVVVVVVVSLAFSAGYSYDTGGKESYFQCRYEHPWQEQYFTIITSMTKPVATAKAIKIDTGKDTNLYTVELKGNTRNAPLCWPSQRCGKGVGVYSLY